MSVETSFEPLQLNHCFDESVPLFKGEAERVRGRPVPHRLPLQTSKCPICVPGHVSWRMRGNEATHRRVNLLPRQEVFVVGAAQNSANKSIEAELRESSIAIIILSLHGKESDSSLGRCSGRCVTNRPRIA